MGALHAMQPVQLAIPDHVQPGEGWSKVMLEMADYIGAREVLVLCESYGGQQVYFPVDPAKAPFGNVIGQAKAEILARAFRGARMTLPTARYALARAKRAGVIAAVRARQLTVSQAAALLHLRRDTISQLVKRPDEGVCNHAALPFRRAKDIRQIEMFPDEGPGADC